MVSVCLPSDALWQHLLSWVSLTLDVGYLVMAAPAKHSRRAERSYCTFKVRRGSVRRYPSSILLYT